nr:hypothetical protein HmN_000589000 [Hymenolepis microstoma]
MSAIGPEELAWDGAVEGNQNEGFKAVTSFDFWIVVINVLLATSKLRKVGRTSVRWESLFEWKIRCVPR